MLGISMDILGELRQNLRKKCGEWKITSNSSAQLWHNRLEFQRIQLEENWYSCVRGVQTFYRNSPLFVWQLPLFFYFLPIFCEIWDDKSNNNFYWNGTDFFFWCLLHILPLVVLSLDQKNFDLLWTWKSDLSYGLFLV